MDGAVPNQYEYIPSVESLQTHVKAGKGKGPDHNDNDFGSGDEWRLNGYHVQDPQGSVGAEGGEEDVTDALMSRGGGETAGERGTQQIPRTSSGGSVSSQNRGKERQLLKNIQFMCF